MSPGAGLRVLPLLGLVLMALPPQGSAQATADAGAPATAPPLEGRVVRGGEPVPGVEVTLHRVTSDSSGVVGSTVSDARGSFSFPLPPVGTSGFTVYFATAEFQTVRYFGDAVHPGDPRVDYPIEVYDTTSALTEAVRVSRRDVVLVPHADGGWEVNEVVRLRNTADRTLVSRSGMPTASVGIPSGAAEFEAGAGDLPAEHIRRMGDRVLLLSPLVPGDREVYLRYRLPPSGRAALRLGDPVDSMNVFVRQPSPHLTITGMEPTDIVTVEGQRFLQLSASGVGADGDLELVWETGSPPVSPVIAGVGAALLLLMVGAGAAFRNRS